MALLADKFMVGAMVGAVVQTELVDAWVSYGEAPKWAKR